MYRKKIYNASIAMLLGNTTLFGADLNTTAIKPIGTTLQNSVEIIDQLSVYGGLISKSLYFIVVAMLIIYMLHKLTSKFLYPHIKKRRMIKVFFATLYVLILVVAVLLVLKKLGFEVQLIGKISILSVLVAAVGVFFLLPFLPRLPFRIGQIVKVKGITGVVDNISTYHTTVRKFDGTMVFIPNTSIMSSEIMNYNDTPNRRITIQIGISNHNNFSTVKALILKLMSDDTRVLKEPAPSILVTNTDATGINIAAYCWVENTNWARTRSDLWENVQNTFKDNDKLSMAREQQEIYFIKP